MRENYVNSRQDIINNIRTLYEEWRKEKSGEEKDY